MSPFAASAAWNLPLPSPKNTRSPATAKPDFAGRMSFSPWSSLKFGPILGNVHAILPVLTSERPRDLTGPHVGGAEDAEWMRAGDFVREPGTEVEIVGRG